MTEDIDNFDTDRAEAVHEHGDGTATEFVGFDEEIETLVGRMDDEIILSLGVSQGNQELSNTAWLTDEQARKLGEALIEYADE